MQTNPHMPMQTNPVESFSAVWLLPFTLLYPHGHVRVLHAHANKPARRLNTSLPTVALEAEDEWRRPTTT